MITTPFYQSLYDHFQNSALQTRYLEHIRDISLSIPRSARWKYSWLDSVLRSSYFPANTQEITIDTSVLDAIPSPRITFIHGYFAPDFSDLSCMPSGVNIQTRSEPEHCLTEENLSQSNDPSVFFFLLNRVFCNQKFTLSIDDGVQFPHPLHIVWLTEPTKQNQAWNTQNRIQIGSRAHVQCIEHVLGHGTSHLANIDTQITLGAYAQFSHLRILAKQNTSTHILRTNINLSTNSIYNRTELDFGCNVSVHTASVQLKGDNAHAHCNGIILTDGQRHAITDLHVAHLCPKTTCQLDWRGISSDVSSLAFQGGIHIHPSALESRAHLSSKNLLLSDNARIDVRPNLVIDVEDVQASHGTTVGQFDPDALFYLRARGITENMAKRILSNAFCHTPLSNLPKELRSWADTYLNQTLLIQETGSQNDL